MALGLGTGSTAGHVLRALAERLADGRLRDLVGVPTSQATAQLARSLGVPVTTLAEQPQLDLAIDGADEISPQLDLIKGLGGAHLREKVVAASARRFVVVADESKLVQRLGERAPLPVEVVEFALPLCVRLLEEAGWRPQVRDVDGAAFRTDQGNLVLDCRRPDWQDPPELARSVEQVPGAVAHGLFLGIAAEAVVGCASGVRVVSRGG
jgi:ribose 5-phosphate isomerase A